MFWWIGVWKWRKPANSNYVQWLSQKQYTKLIYLQLSWIVIIKFTKEHKGIFLFKCEIDDIYLERKTFWMFEWRPMNVHCFSCGGNMDVHWLSEVIQTYVKVRPMDVIKGRLMDVQSGAVWNSTGHPLDVLCTVMDVQWILRISKRNVHWTYIWCTCAVWDGESYSYMALTLLTEWIK